jgi:hypothetical protein
MRELSLELERDREGRYWATEDHPIASTRLALLSAAVAALLVANAAEPMRLFLLCAAAGMRVLPTNGWPQRAALKACSLCAAVARGKALSWPDGNLLRLLAPLLLALVDATALPFRYLLPLQLLEAAILLRASFAFLRRLPALPWLCQTTYEAMCTIAGFNAYDTWDQCSSEHALRHTAVALHLFLMLALPALLCYCTERAAKPSFIAAEAQLCKLRRAGAGRPAHVWGIQLLALLMFGACASDTASDLLIWAWPEAFRLDSLEA